MRKYALFLVLVIFILGCRFTAPTPDRDDTVDDETTRDNVCYSELNLSDAECNNVGTHEYEYDISISGIGGTECANDDGSTVDSGYSTYTFTFLDSDRVEYAHPTEEIWGEFVHTLEETGVNTYLYSGMLDNMNTSWEVEFESWGFHEELRLTWDCENGTCGCVYSGDFDIYN
jgi:hypothetical protein